MSGSSAVRVLRTFPERAGVAGGRSVRGQMGWNPTSMPRVETRSPRVDAGPVPLPCGPETSRVPMGTVTEPGVADTAHGGLVVRVETVRAERKADFDLLVREVVAPAAERSGRCMRTLEPSAPNSDGSWSYVTVYDAAIGDVDDARLRLLEREYGAAAAEHERRYRECRRGEAISYAAV